MNRRLVLLGLVVVIFVGLVVALDSWDLEAEIAQLDGSWGLAKERNGE